MQNNNDNDQCVRDDFAPNYSDDRSAKVDTSWKSGQKGNKPY